MSDFELLRPESIENLARSESSEVDRQLEETAQRIENVASAGEDVRPHLEAAAEGLWKLVVDGITRWGDGLAHMAEGVRAIAPELGSAAADALEKSSEILSKGAEAIRADKELFKSAVRLVILAAMYRAAPDVMSGYFEDNPDILRREINFLLAKASNP